jgi:hypothetical protein
MNRFLFQIITAIVAIVTVVIIHLTGNISSFERMDKTLVKILGVPVVIAVVVGIRLIAGRMNHNRIHKYVELRGGIVLDITWEPFGPGWFGEGGNDVIYHVIYVDQQDAHHDAYCKTSMWSGVYFTKDVVTRHSPAVLKAEESKKKATASLQDENRRLREELEALKRGRGNNP